MHFSQEHVGCLKSCPLERFDKDLHEDISPTFLPFHPTITFMFTNPLPRDGKSEKATSNKHYDDGASHAPNMVVRRQYAHSPTHYYPYIRVKNSLYITISSYIHKYIHTYIFVML